MELWRAFAKVNLDLEVWNRRDDGYHEIRTTLQTVDLVDEIRVAPGDCFRFATSEGPVDETNLVVRAVRSFERETGITVNLQFDVFKGIPSGAGLGGGSADAAVTLLALNRRFNAGITGERLAALLAGLGSDVPFFGVGGCALAVGRGEVVFPLPDLIPGCFVLVSPPIRVSTGEAYSWLTGRTRSNNILGFCARFAELQGLGGSSRLLRANDFESPLFRRFPELAEIKQVLLASGAQFASLTGSGSTLYGQFASEAAAKCAASALGSDWKVSVARPVGRPEYFRRMFGR